MVWLMVPDELVFLQGFSCTTISGAYRECPENVKIFSGLRLYGPYDQQGAVRWEGPTALIWQEDNNNSNKHTTQPTYTEENIWKHNTSNLEAEDNTGSRSYS